MALAAAGCGKDEEVSFRKEKLNPLEKKVEEQKSILSAQLRTVKLGSDEDARLLNRQIDRLAAVYRDMAALEPPGSVEGQYEQYMHANTGLVEALRRFARGLAAGSSKRLNRLGEEATNATGAAQRAEQAVDQGLAG